MKKKTGAGRTARAREARVAKARRTAKALRKALWFQRLHDDREHLHCLHSGHWGLIQVLPWTTASEVTKEFKRIRRSIGNTKRWTEKPQIITHLKRNGFSDREIAEALDPPPRGDEDPTVDRKVGEYKRRGDDYKHAVSKARKQVADTVRIARRRNDKQWAREMQMLEASPLEADPLSALLTKMLRPLSEWQPASISQLRKVLSTPPRH